MSGRTQRLQFSSDCGHRLTHFLIVFDLLFNTVDRVQHRRVVATAKKTTNRRKRLPRKLLREIHRHVPAEHSLGFLRHLEWLSPAAHHKGLWLAGLTAPVLSVVAYLSFAAVFILLAIWKLERRDL